LYRSMLRSRSATREPESHFQPSVSNSWWEAMSVRRQSSHCFSVWVAFAFETPFASFLTFEDAAPGGTLGLAHRSSWRRERDPHSAGSLYEKGPPPRFPVDVGLPCTC